MKKTWLDCTREDNVETGFLEVEGVKYEYFIVLFMGTFNGYIHMPKVVTKEDGWNGVLTYVPVHGGITFAEPDGSGGITYGFDTKHFNSGEYPIHDLQWIRAQILLMLQGVLLASKIEPAYLATEDNEVRDSLLQPLRDLTTDTDISFGVCINLLFGKL